MSIDDKVEHVRPMGCEKADEDFCIYKRIANKDKAKMEKGNYIVTFGPDAMCHECDGYKYVCETYTSKKMYNDLLRQD